MIRAERLSRNAGKVQAVRNTAFERDAGGWQFSKIEVQSGTRQ